MGSQNLTNITVILNVGQQASFIAFIVIAFEKTMKFELHHQVADQTHTVIRVSQSPFTDFFRHVNTFVTHFTPYTRYLY